MQYKKIHLELIVFAEEADAVVTELNTMLDDLEQKHTLFGGEIEAVAVKHEGTRKRSALGHTRAAGETAAGALRNGLSVALRTVIG